VWFLKTCRRINLPLCINRVHYERWEILSECKSLLRVLNDLPFGMQQVVRNRLRNYHMIDWIDAQLEVYIYVS
jgi:hypothetical protein